ncbi:amino acid ABC transporter substrate-binding protein, PAAT family [Trichlorobacter thiogenes]|uniref:Amino acid ABC transporter substrate-binding protein, PAAT family n=1 Tax=Trichlorobacter thiogenes TaxID=115783 RepID=A0A1T4NVD4_9BACT|nr:transporter substrate-binding domain-containing protein [Trichlorobacter thiogenes]SJZ83211.1 amino acid ABC transporter substrate-binding protein, PAAT family [Trichlorobacter thiogenes]
MKTLLQLILAILLASPLYAAQTLVLGTADRPPLSTEDHKGFSDRVIIEACKRLGIEAKIIPLASARTLSNAEQALDDGNFLRIAGAEKKFPNLVRVPEPIIEVQFVIFSKNKELKTPSWESLKPYHVGHVRGWLIAEEKIKDVRQITVVENRTSLFKVLENDRIELAFAELYGGYYLMHTLNLPHLSIAQPPLATKEMFLYLNKKHEKLVPKLAKALREMKRDGSYDAIFKQTLAPYLPAKYHRKP